MEIQTLVKEICPTATQTWVEKGALLVDVREVNEVEKLTFEVPNIINIPLSQFEERFHEIPKDQKIIMVCSVGVRSLRAVGFLVNHGYENVVNMKHGLEKWVQKGFPTLGDRSIVVAKDTCCSDTKCC